MFSKSKINEPGPGQPAQPAAGTSGPGAAPTTGTAVGPTADYRPQAPKAKPPASVSSTR